MQFNTTGQAIYLQIVDFVCEKVLLDEYQPEDKLPSVREMGMQLEVNPNTVMRAANSCESISLAARTLGSQLSAISTVAARMVESWRAASPASPISSNIRVANAPYRRVEIFRFFISASFWMVVSRRNPLHLFSPGSHGRGLWA